MERKYNLAGADPGATGAIAFLHGNRVTVFAMPMLQEKSGRTYKPRTDVPGLIALARSIASMEPDRVVIERVWGIKGQGAGTGAALGHQRGCLEVAFAAAGCKVELVSPQAWKGRAGLTQKSVDGVKRKKTDKETSRLLALQLWPDDAEYFTPKRNVRTKEQCQGNAEAALIAKFGALQ